jgi:hypothetical protein
MPFKLYMVALNNSPSFNVRQTTKRSNLIMKKIFILFLSTGICILMSSCEDPSNETDNADGKKYRIKTIVQRKVSSKDSTEFIYQDNRVAEFTTFVQINNIWHSGLRTTLAYKLEDIYLEKFWTYEEDLLLNTYEYKYKNNQITLLTVKRGPGLNPYFSYVADPEGIDQYIYNDKGKLMKVISETSNSLEEFKYDQQDKISSHAIYKFETEPSMVDSFYYKNNKVSQIHLYFRTVDLHFFNRRIYRYNNKGLVSRMDYFLTKDDSGYQGYLAYYYNNNGLLIRTARMDGNKLLEEIIYRYEDGEGNAIIFNNDIRLGFDHNPTYMRKNAMSDQKEEKLGWSLGFRPD